ncbi:polysaccharide biosynthesis tyrosine autokinase [Brachybacterium hainanense]|uniref:non-specific protein-tyrosine kinase n=1 Tax=Brachybacterium hainanense TaxID=1541174 RepID=A0ABV6R742_9MICO
MTARPTARPGMRYLALEDAGGSSDAARALPVDGSAGRGPLTPQRFPGVLRERWRAALVAALLVVAAVTAATLLPAPQYEASASLFVRTTTSGSISDRSVAADYARGQITTYADLATTPLVLDPVIEELALPTSSPALARSVSAAVPQDTSLIVVTARAGTPGDSAALADAVAASLRTQVEDLEGPTSVELTVVTPATVPDRQASPDVLQNIVLGAVAAVLAALLAALVRDLLDTRVRTAEDIRRLTDAPLLAAVPTVRRPEALVALTDRDAQGILAEAYRELRTNLRFLEMRGRSRSLLVTSSREGEGKTTTAINLAAALARADQRVLLVDADLRDPSVHRRLGLEGGAGLSTLLIGDAELEDLVQPLALANLTVLASGPVPPNPSELLDSDQMTAFLAEATGRYDIVVLDSAPLLAVTDATAIALRVSGTAFVTGSGSVSRAQLALALHKLLLVQARVLGIVLNRTPRSERTPYEDVYGAAAARSSRPEDASGPRTGP